MQDTYDGVNRPPKGEINIDKVEGNIAESIIAAGDVHDVQIGDTFNIHNTPGGEVVLAKTQNFWNVIGSPSAALAIYQECKLLLWRCRRWLSAVVLAQVCLWALFARFRDRYLLAGEVHLLLATLLLAALLPLLLRGGQMQPKMARWALLLLSVAACAAFLSLSAWQVWSVLQPARFTPAQFGIAIATFGDGSNYAAPATGYSLADRLLVDLSQAVAAQPGLADSVTLRRIGVIGDDPQQAILDGQRTGASLVIWGRIVPEGSSLQIHFNILQTPELIDDPVFPQQLPTMNRVLDDKLIVAEKQLGDFEAVVSEQSLGLTAFSLGLVHYYARRYSPAASQFEVALGYLQPQEEMGNAQPTGAALADGSSTALMYYYLGRSYQMLARYEDSQAMLNRAAQLNPNDIATLLAQAYNYRVFGQEEERKRAYAQLVEASFKQPEWMQKQAAYNRALAYAAMNDDEAALSEHTNLIKRYPDFFVAYLGAAGALLELDQLDEAEATYEQAAALVNGDTARQVWLELGKAALLTRRGDLAGAMAGYQRAIALDTGHMAPSAYYYLARLHAARNERKQAIGTYQKLIEVSELPGPAHKNLADYLHSIGEHARAIAEYKAALRYPLYDAGLTHAQLGLAYAALAKAGKPEHAALALQLFEEALADPGSNEAYIRSAYGHVLFELDPGNVAEAIDQLEKSLQVDESLAEVTRLNLGRLYRYAGATGEAAAMFQSLARNCAAIAPATYAAALDELIQLGIEANECPNAPDG